MFLIELKDVLRNEHNPDMPRRALAFLLGIVRRGAEWIPHFAGGIGHPFQQTPIKIPERRKQAASGGRFF
jgi:hypothetical protein